MDGAVQSLPPVFFHGVYSYKFAFFVGHFNYYFIRLTLSVFTNFKRLSLGETSRCDEST